MYVCMYVVNFNFNIQNCLVCFLAVTDQPLKMRPVEPDASITGGSALATSPNLDYSLQMSSQSRPA